MNRRSLLKFLGLAPVAAVIPTATASDVTPRHFVTAFGAQWHDCVAEFPRFCFDIDVGKVAAHRDLQKSTVQALASDPEFRQAAVNEYVAGLLG